MAEGNSNRQSRCGSTLRLITRIVSHPRRGNLRNQKYRAFTDVPACLGISCRAHWGLRAAETSDRLAEPLFNHNARDLESMVRDGRNGQLGIPSCFFASICVGNVPGGPILELPQESSVAIAIFYQG